MKVCSIPLAVLLLTVSRSASADTDTDTVTDTEQLQEQQLKQQDQPFWFPKLLGLQFNAIYQYLPYFSSPYAGPHSFMAGDDLSHKLTHIYGIYLGSQITPSAQIYFDIEMARGSGISNAIGLGGITNGDVIRQGGSNLTHGPYVARLYLRKLFPLSGETEEVEKGIDQLPGKEPTNRVEAKVGKLAATDDFDLNRYANNTRTQFMNWGFINDTAWDFAADTRGYSYGFIVALVKPTWRLAFGSYMMPRTANGSVMDNDFLRARGDNLELTLKLNDKGTVIRLLAYHNEARMGDYAEALAIAQASSTTPNITSDERPGRHKYGLGFNMEQPLADDGETGAFLRAGWNDGHTEDFVFTEVDRHLSTGVQVSGAHWKRSEDRFGVAYLAHGLSAQHQEYLAAGGIGFLLGDGRLNYGWEQILEVYYRVQIGRFVQVTPDFQHIENPGYNRDRGPADVYSMRLRVVY